jgi:hypothetical protein
MMNYAAVENAGEIAAETILVLDVSHELKYSCFSTIPHMKSVG